MRLLLLSAACAWEVQHDLYSRFWPSIECRISKSEEHPGPQQKDLSHSRSGKGGGGRLSALQNGTASFGYCSLAKRLAKRMPPKSIYYTRECHGNEYNILFLDRVPVTVSYCRYHVLGSWSLLLTRHTCLLHGVRIWVYWG